MVSYEVFEQGIEVNGSTIMVVVAGFGDFRALADRSLRQAGLSDVQDSLNSWYPQQDWLDAFKAISQKVGSSVLFRIGKQIPEHAELPPGMDSIEAILQGADAGFHMNHRNAKGEVLFDPNRFKPMLEGIGHYGYELVGEKKIVMECNNPYPCDFDFGLITAFAQKHENLAKIRHDDTKPCRKDGADSCTYIIEW